MRCYHFGNMYMSSIQQGIQAAHAQTELSLGAMKLDKDSKEYKQYIDWAENHKTIICLNGGMDYNLKELLNIMYLPGNTYHWTSFYESQEAMDGMLTNIAIVLPDYIYETASKIRSREYMFVNTTLVYTEIKGKVFIEHNFTEFDKKLIEVLNSCSLAR